MHYKYEEVENLEFEPPTSINNVSYDYRLSYTLLEQNVFNITLKSFEW